MLLTSHERTDSSPNPVSGVAHVRRHLSLLLFEDDMFDVQGLQRILGLRTCLSTYNRPDPCNAGHAQSAAAQYDAVLLDLGLPDSQGSKA